MGYRIETVTGIVPRQRRPRQTTETHLAFIRELSCVISGTRPVDPAHLRAGNMLLGKRHVGLSEKPDDRWVTPLSRTLHDEQHRRAELIFWSNYGIENPWQLCLALWSVSGDTEAAEAILAEHRKLVSIIIRQTRRTKW